MADKAARRAVTAGTGADGATGSGSRGMSGSLSGDSRPGDLASPTARGFGELAREGDNAPWRYGVSAFLVLLVYVGLGGLLSSVPAILAGSDGDASTYLDDRTLEVVGYPVSEFVALTLGFAFLWAGLYVAVRFVHRRPFLTLITTRRRVGWRRVAQGFGIYLLLVAAAFFVGYLLAPQDFRLVLEPANLLAFVPVVLALIPVQAAAEELLFRGYLLQLFGLATSSVIVLSLINGVLFALPHLGNPELPAVGEGFWIACADFVVFGFLMTAVTLRDGGMELAVGAHVANNVFVFLMVNSEATSLATPSVFERLDPTLGPADFAGTVAACAAFYLLVFHVFGRKTEAGSSRGHREHAETPSFRDRG